MTDPLYPPHYTNTTIEPMDVIEDWELPHHLACVLKYMKRYREKGHPVEDLEKARWYLDRFILSIEPPMSKQEIQSEATKMYNYVIDYYSSWYNNPWGDRDKDAG